MSSEPPRSRTARAAAEQALVRVVHNYGARPEFVVLGGLVPELLCSDSEYRHAGTTDIDVQVDLEIACGTVNTAKLERALRNAEFQPVGEHIWRWTADGTDAPRALVKFELLADLNDVASEDIVRFDHCEELGAVNLRGTGFAARDFVIRPLSATIGGIRHDVEINVTGLAGFLLAKTAAAYARRKPKDWYDLAFVLLHNDAGGPEQAAQAVRQHFGAELAGPLYTALRDLRANFADENAQGPRAYADQMLIDHPELDRTRLIADAIIAVDTFWHALFEK